MAINYKNVVSVQTHIASIAAAGGLTAGISGFTFSNEGISGAGGHVPGITLTFAVDIIKHKGVVLVPNPSNAQAMTVLPTFFGADGNALVGNTLSAGGAAGAQYPLEIPLRMKSFTGLTGGSILFVV